MAPSALGPRVKAAANITLLECSDIENFGGRVDQGVEDGAGTPQTATPQQRNVVAVEQLHKVALGEEIGLCEYCEGGKNAFSERDPVHGVGLRAGQSDQATCDTRRVLSQQSVCAHGLGARCGSARNNSAHWMSTMSAAAKTPRAYGSLIRPSTSGARILNPVNVRACRRKRLVPPALQRTGQNAHAPSRRTWRRSVARALWCR